MSIGLDRWLGAKWPLWMLAAAMVIAAGMAQTPVAAQSTTPGAAPDAAASFKDWELFCPAAQPKDKPRICEMRTVIKGKEGGRLGALAVALNPEPGSADVPMIATALLPLGVDLTLAPALKVGKDKAVLLQFRRCLQRGCEAVALLNDTQLRAMRTGTIAKVAVGIGGGKTAVFEFSLIGFTFAHDAMKKLIGKS